MEITGLPPVRRKRIPKAPVVQQQGTDPAKKGAEIPGAMEAVDQIRHLRNRFMQPCGRMRSEVKKNLTDVRTHEIDASIGKESGEETDDLLVRRRRIGSHVLQRIAVHGTVANRLRAQSFQGGMQLLGRCAFHGRTATMLPGNAMDIQSRYQEIKDRIARAAERSGRNPAEITLIAVTKTVTTSAVRTAFEAGIQDIGENRVQELLRKQSEADDLPIRWHFIGHLQTNKVRQVLPIATMIHSVESSRLANRIHELAADRGGVDVLLQVNTSDEVTKFGVAPSELPELIASIRGLDHLRIRGLMTLGPLTDDIDAIRHSFRGLRRCSQVLRETVPDAAILSMGMTSDFEIAIEEGATHVRICTALFGPRTCATT